MKNWYDLTKEEQKELKKEFSKKKKMVDIRIPLYILSMIAFIPCIAIVVSMNNDACYGNACQNSLLMFGTIFILLLLAAIINSLLVSNHQKAFNSWLKFKNISK